MKSSSLMPITESGNAVFAPAVGTRARVIVREVVPPCTIRTVVFSQWRSLNYGPDRFE